jgi:hypothetical protein
VQKLNQLHWPLIIGMGALALVRPFLSITGWMDGLGRPFGPIFVTALISVAWLVIVVIAKIRDPLLTLACTGLAYGVFAIALSAILSPLLTGALAGPLAHPLAVIPVLVTNLLWGGIIGSIAWGIQRVLPSARL